MKALGRTSSIAPFPAKKEGLLNPAGGDRLAAESLIFHDRSVQQAGRGHSANSQAIKSACHGMFAQ